MQFVYLFSKFDTIFFPTKIFQIHYFIEKEFIDIEKSTEQSEPFYIHLFGDTAFLQTISLPIHFRYHAPGNKR